MGVLLLAMASPLYTAPVCWSGSAALKLLPELSMAMVACALAPPAPANPPVGSTPGFQPRIVPSSVSKRNTAGADAFIPILFSPVIGKAPPLAVSVLNTVPVGVPPVSPTGVGIFTTRGFIDTAVLLVPGTL